MTKAVEEDQEAQLDGVDPGNAKDSVHKHAVQRQRHVFHKGRRYGNQAIGNIFHDVHVVQAQLSDAGRSELYAQHSQHDPVLGHEAAKTEPSDVGPRAETDGT